MAVQNSTRVLYHDTFDGKGFTNENTLSNALLSKPDTIDPVLTHLMGKETNKFPLSFLSEGQKGTGGMAGSIGIKDIQYDYPVINRINRPDVIVSHNYSITDKAGLGKTPIYLSMKTNWLKVQHTVENGRGTQMRVMERPTRDGIYWRYKFQLLGNNLFSYLSPEDIAPGTKWAMVGGANVAQSLSMGNESNVVAPGKMKNQLSVLRKSYRLAGNISNKIVECKFNNGSNMWIDFERWQHMIRWKEAIEEHCWYARYNRLPDGTIYDKDPDSGLPIPIMAGVLDQIPNHDTYSFLTAKKLKSTVRDVMYGATDTGSMDVVLFTGLGGMEEFDQAMKEQASGFTQIVGDKFIKGSGRHLILGGYFTQYEHIDGHVITVKHLPLLDHGNRALVAAKHPITGLPMSSYDMYFVDMSVYDGKRNCVMLHEKGRGMITGIRRGMAATPVNFAGNNNLNVDLGTEQDESSIHFLSTKGLLMRRNTHSFVLTCDLS